MKKSSCKRFLKFEVPLMKAIGQVLKNYHFTHKVNKQIMQLKI